MKPREDRVAGEFIPAGRLRALNDEAQVARLENLAEVAESRKMNGATWFHSMRAILRRPHAVVCLFPQPSGYVRFDNLIINFPVVPGLLKMDSGVSHVVERSESCSWRSVIMAYRIGFNKQDAVRWLQALSTGGSLIPSEGKWTIEKMLALAGTLHFAVQSHGPLAMPEAWEKLRLEHREASEETFLQDLTDAIEFNSVLAMKVKDGEFDESCDHFVQAIIYREGDQKKVIPVTGFRKT